MPGWLIDNPGRLPGRLYVLATLLPLAMFALLLLGGLIRALARPYRRDNAAGAFFYYLFGGDKPLKAGAYMATGGIAVSAVLALVGLVLYFVESGNPDIRPDEFQKHWEGREVWAQLGSIVVPEPKDVEDYDAAAGIARDWAKIAPDRSPYKPAMTLELGYRIDALTAILFAMVTFISTCIFVFSLGYMRDEAEEIVTDHEVLVPSKPPEGDHDVHASVPDDHAAEHEHDRSGHLRRHGRYGRFFLYLSLFCFSMLNLLIADNLFQVFISWELVGVCSFFLIGFYTERNSASTAANKAFIVNRIGDAGFLIGLAIVWSYFGTFNFQDIQYVLRCPAGDVHNDKPPYDVIGTMVRGDWTEEMSDSEPERVVRIAPHGKEVLIFPTKYANVTKRARPHWHADSLQSGKTISDFNTIPYYLLVIAGIGIFLGCVGKSAQFPLQTWLPDAMEGPTPVSALIHAATMVAAGVYLVGRAYPIFTPEVLLFIAYTGAITLFLAATIALVQTDIKRVLAYSTVSQLGYMMLALGVGGWAPGLFHLLTHAFFKALLFLASGAVIFGLHHEQDLRKMGGLFWKMPITAVTMLIGVLAIVGTPFFSGWYSKDQIIGQAIGYGLTHKEHLALAVLPLLSAAMTAFYMFRLWFMAFGGPPRDAHIYEHAHEAPWIMTLPLIVLAIFSFGIGWGPQFWSADGSLVGHVLEEAQPSAAKLEFEHESHSAHEHHMMAGLAALASALLGAAIAVWVYGLRKVDPEALRSRIGPLHVFLMKKWYFDELYNAVFVVPVVKLAYFIGRFDKRTAAPADADAADRRIDPSSVDGFLSALGLLMGVLGQRLRALQTGLIRSYVLVLVLTTVMIFAILSFLAS